MSDFTLNDMRAALQYISPAERETWTSVGMGLKAEFGEQAFDLWIEWSQGDTAFKVADAKAVWKSFRKGGVSLGTVVHLARQAGWKPAQREMTAEERKRLTQEADARRKARQAEVEADEARLRVMQHEVAAACQRIWDEFTIATGTSPYLERKQVGAYGIRFLRQKVLLAVDDQRQTAEIWTGSHIQTFFDHLPKPRPDHLSFTLFPAGALVVPLWGSLTGDDYGLCALQVISAEGTKLFPKYGQKSGSFHRLASLVEAPVVAIGEGYATMAAVHELTGWPCVVAFDAGNLPKVAETLRWMLPEAQIIITGDNDRATPGNPGAVKAQAAAAAVGGVVGLPSFAEGSEGSDWNDLVLAEGADVARTQLLPLLQASAQPAVPSSLPAQADVGEEVPLDAYATDAEAAPCWELQLMRTDGGVLIGNHANAYAILAHDPRWKGVLAYNEFSQRIVKRVAPPYEGGTVGDWEDADIGKALVWLQREWRLPLKQPKSVDEAARLVAYDNSFHEVRDWLNQLPAWDGERRLWHFLPQAFGTSCNEYTGHIGTGWLVSAVARILQPGCKVDTMLVLEGGQGLGKSTAIRDLFTGNWYLETSEPPHSKDFLVLLQGNWVVEIGEMQSFSKADITLVKQIITRRDDKFRAPYDRYGTAHPRQCIFVGTTNADTYLSDPTGARRFLPVQCTAVDLDYIRQHRSQLWAEALVEYHAGFHWWEFPEDQANAEQEMRYVGDSWEEPIARWLEGQCAANSYPDNLPGRIDKVTTTQLLCHALGVEMGRHTRQDQLRVATVMRRMGWRLGNLERVGSARLRFYYRPEADLSQPPGLSQHAA